VPTGAHLAVDLIAPRRGRRSIEHPIDGGHHGFTLALMDDLERIPVGVEDIGGIVSRIVFQPCAGRNVVPGTSGHCGLVEFIDLLFIFGHETPVNGCWIRLPLLYPEERLLAVTKSPQIGMTVFALVRQEELDIKRPQGRLIEGQRTFDIADSQNDVVEQRGPTRRDQAPFRCCLKKATVRCQASAAAAGR
jgi:hypothetical protein